MNAPDVRHDPRPAALRWLIGIALVAVIAIALMMASASSFDAHSKALPTPCPDTIACHALKRMPTQSAPANTP